jgi:hypothetical protein
LIVGPTSRHHSSASLHVCNKLIDVFPQRAIIDSGASDHFVSATYTGDDPQTSAHGLPVQCANGMIMKSTGTDLLSLPRLPLKARGCHKFNEVTTSLFSVGKLCDNNLHVTFSNSKVVVTDTAPIITGSVVMEGTRDGGVYSTSMSQQPSPPSMNTESYTGTASLATTAQTYEVKTVDALINYYHMTLGSPTINEWINCINKSWFKSWHGLTADRVRKYCTKKEQTTFGNQRMVSKNVKSTQVVDPIITKQRLSLRRKLHDIGTFIIGDDDLKNLIAMDMPGRYPLTSARGHKYIMVFYDYDLNYINAIPIKSRKSSELVNAFTICYDELKQRGFKARVLRLDNEISKELINAIDAAGLDYQIASPGDHRLNDAERAIQTFKARFISHREGTDPTFPKSSWDLMIPQIVLVMNLMRPSRINPLLSAYTQLHGEFDFNRTPIAPIGCKVIVHDRRNERGSWDNHGSPGYYINRAEQHYRNYKCYMKDTKSTRISNTVEFFPTYCTLPRVRSIDRLTMILQDLHEVLSQPPRTIPFLQQGTDLSTALQAIQKILCIVEDDTATSNPITTITPPRVDTSTVVTTPPKRVTRATTAATLVFINGTIISRRFSDGIHEGEIKQYDPKEKYYKVLYKDGDTEEMTHAEIKQYRKKSQKYNPVDETALFSSHILTQLNLISTTTDQPSPFSNGYDKGVQMLERQQHSPSINTAFAAGGAIWDEELNKMAKYRDLINHDNPATKDRWLRSGENEFARLFQGYGETDGMDVLEWVHRQDIPRNKQVTYPRYVVDIRPEKAEPYRTRITAGGDRIDYSGDVTTHTASMETIKMHWNSVVSTPNAKYCTADISNMYLCSLLPDEEYVRFKYDMIPPNIIKHYKLDTFVNGDFVYAKIKKAWYGLKQSGKIAHDDLVQHLAKYGYLKAKRTDGLFLHKTRDLSFTLVVDDFGIKYTNKDDVDHLIAAVRDKYPLKVDWDAKQYVGIHLQWDYARREVICSMDGYVEQALKELQHTVPKQIYKGPSKIERPDYGVKVQYVKHDTTATLSAEQIKFIQRTTGKFLFYARAIDNTMLHALNDIATSTINGTEATLAATNHFLNYAASNPNGKIIYRGSDMILKIDSDAAYLVRPEARSRAGGYHYLSSKDGTLFNGPIIVLAKIIKNVMASAAEAEVAGIYLNAQEGVSERNCLIEMGHPQPPTPIRTDNTTARGIVTGTIKQKRSKAIDMRFYWLKDRYEQKQFDFIWGPGIENLGDYPTKHHTGTHHSVVRPIYLYVKDISPSTLQGCVKLLAR